MSVSRILRRYMNVNRIRFIGGGGGQPPMFQDPTQFGPHFDRPGAVAIDGMEWQMFCCTLRNSGGTLQHKIVGDLNAGNRGAFQYKLRASSTAFVNTPSLGAGTGFSQGGGILSGANSFIFDTNPQVQTMLAGVGKVDYYSGNVAAKPLIAVSIAARNIGGVTIPRLEFYFTNGFTAAAWNLNTTNIPSGTEIDFRFMGFLF